MDYDDDFYDADTILEPCGSCDECGCDLDADEDGTGLCGQCSWWLSQSGE